MKFPQGFHLLSMLFWCLSALACVLNLWHAKEPDSPEPDGHTTRYRVLMFLCIGMAFASGIARFTVPLPDRYGTGWVIYFWVTYVWFTGAVVGAAALYARFVHNNRVRRARKWRRQWGSAGYLAVVLACLSFLTGCVTNPNTGKTTVDLSQAPANIDLWTTFAEDAIVLATPAGPQQDRLIREAELLRKAADLPSLQKLLASLPKSVPTTQAVK